jgi:acyl-coenzyme A synthetase/AMP-(fatty) acid ligase
VRWSSTSAGSGALVGSGGEAPGGVAPSSDGRDGRRISRTRDASRGSASGEHDPDDPVRDPGLHVHGRVVDCTEVDGRLVSPVVLLDLLCRRGDVRYAVIVLDPDTGDRVAAVLPCPDRPVDTAGCLDTTAGAFGPSVVSSMRILPVDAIPLTEPGKPNRPEIRRLGRELAPQDER